jgi:hypothetical protein
MIHVHFLLSSPASSAAYTRKTVIATLGTRTRHFGFVVHRIHGIRGNTLWRASADAEQEPRCAAQSDLAPARISSLVTRGSGRVGRSDRSARKPAFQATVARGSVTRIPPVWAGPRERPRERRNTSARAGPRGRYPLSSVSRSGANHGRICSAYSRDPDQGTGECTSTTTIRPFSYFWVLPKRWPFFVSLFSFFPHISQGHSSWGEFELIGRVRAGDGFVTLSKEYVSVPPFFSDSVHRGAPRAAHHL